MTASSFARSILRIYVRERKFADSSSRIVVVRISSSPKIYHIAFYDDDDDDDILYTTTRVLIMVKTITDPRDLELFDRRMPLGRLILYNVCILHST